jgi:hypothetical protein
VSDAGATRHEEEEAERAPREDAERMHDHVLAVRAGHGANCSSIGSVIDILFASAVVGAAVFAAVSAALASEPVRVVGAREREREAPRDASGGDERTP